jgi:hypothetical protein
MHKVSSSVVFKGTGSKFFKKMTKTISFRNPKN